MTGTEQLHEQWRDQLVDLCHELGREERELAILGEGNASLSCGDGTFWIKASGANLGALGPQDASRIRLEPILRLLERPEMAEEEIERELILAQVEPGHRKPSVETFLHAVCLSEGEANWVAHVHSVAVNRILCSRLGAQPFLGHVFPDAVVVCGPAPAVVPYVDPGFALGVAARTELRRYRQKHGGPPKLLLLTNHGPVALGSSAREALNIMLMADKWARIVWGSYALGGPAFLPQSEVARIDGRLDEQYRRARLGEDPS
ncbi:MAG: class II aldolase/adducin family protein [Trueperaceae bacterium]